MQFGEKKTQKKMNPELFFLKILYAVNIQLNMSLKKIKICKWLVMNGKESTF